MGIYTVKGSGDLDRRIDSDLQRIAAAARPLSLAGILIGGYGRGEGTPFIRPDGTQTPFNDYDLVVVVEQVDCHVRATFRALERRLSDELGFDVDLCPYAKDALPDCEFSLLNYEMKYGHKVVWGDDRILDALPDYPEKDIPLSEGSRLLLNRGKLLLDIRQRLARQEPLDDEERIRFIKFIRKAWLAFGDCALLADRKYDILYDVKRSRIGSVGEIPRRDDVIKEYLAAIDLKAWGDFHARLAVTDIHKEFQRVRDVFLEFFTWYRKKHPARECPLFKAMLLNLQWYRWPYLAHPRQRLYAALPELLKDQPDRLAAGQALCCSRGLEERFYQLQSRFS